MNSIMTTAPSPYHIIFNWNSAPENTMAAFDDALAKGMAIELDIQRTAYDHLVVVHAPTVDRTTNGPGKSTTICYMM
jgi:glycerophosphoryl diester phosphodiesterase